MSSFGGSVGHEKKLETAKEKKEQADKAFQASDLPTGTCCGFFGSFEVGWFLNDRLVWGGG